MADKIDRTIVEQLSQAGWERPPMVALAELTYDGPGGDLEVMRVPDKKAFVFRFETQENEGMLQVEFGKDLVGPLRLITSWQDRLDEATWEDFLDELAESGPTTYIIKGDGPGDKRLLRSRAQIEADDT